MKINRLIACLLMFKIVLSMSLNNSYHIYELPPLANIDQENYDIQKKYLEGISLDKINNFQLNNVINALQQDITVAYSPVRIVAMSRLLSFARLEQNKRINNLIIKS